MNNGTLTTQHRDAEEPGSFDSNHKRMAGAAPSSQRRSRKANWIGPILLLGGVAAIGMSLAMWKANANESANAAAANQPEYSEVVTVAAAREREHRRTTTSIGTVVALRSIGLRNEVAGTVAETNLVPGQVVEPGAVLVAFDVSVEQAELKALQAQAALARNLAERMERAIQGRATSQIELDRARSELDVANAQIARTEAVIARKTIRAPFKARIGLSDIHPGQYLNEGTLIASLQGVAEATQVDFAVPQLVAQGLQVGETVQVIAGPGQPPIVATISALDSRVDPATRNVTIRARIDDSRLVPAPGSSVRVEAPAGEPFAAVAVPVNALRKGPEGDHVYLIAPDPAGKPRAQTRRVTAGPMLGDEILILSGLKPGEQVASFGSFKLREGALVSVSEQPAGQAAN